MAAADITAWRKQNSDPIKVELFMTDGSRRIGVVLKPRDKTLREIFNQGHERFVDFDCAEYGETIVAKPSIMEIRPYDIKRDADKEAVKDFEAKAALVERADAHSLLGVQPGAAVEEIHAAYIKRARAYHPDRFGEIDIPAEIRTYLDAMARRINAAYSELNQKNR